MFSVQDGALLQYHLPGIVCVCVQVWKCVYVCMSVSICWNASLLQRQAWSGHQRECKCLRSLLPRIPTDSVRLAARLIFALVCFLSFSHCWTLLIMCTKKDAIKFTIYTFSSVSCNFLYIAAELLIFRDIHVFISTKRLKAPQLVLENSTCSRTNEILLKTRA